MVVKRAIRAGTITNPSKESTDLLYNFEGNNGDTSTLMQLKETINLNFMDKQR